MEVQVSKEHYDFNKYVDEKRWNSYYYQINEAINSKGNDILIIGKGDGIVPSVIKLFNKNVTTFDFDENLKPDIVGSVTEIDKILKKKYDVIICCQVLEHIPFEQFENILKKIKNCYKEKIILSLPNCNTWLKINLKIPKIKEWKLQVPIKKIKKPKWDINKQGNGEHYWEIDADGYDKSKIETILKKYFNMQFFIPNDNNYHMFYILTNKK